MGFRSSVSLLPAIQTTGLWLLPRRAYPPLNAPAFAGRTFWLEQVHQTQPGTTLSCLLHVRPIQPSPSPLPQVVQFDRRSRLCLPCRQSRYRQRRFPPPALPGFTGTTSPSATLSPAQPFPGLLRPTAPPISQRGEEGFSSCLARPRHRTRRRSAAVCATPAFVQDLRTQPAFYLEATLCVSLSATRRPPLTVVVSASDPVPCHPNSGLWLLPRRAYPPLNAPALLDAQVQVLLVATPLAIRNISCSPRFLCYRRSPSRASSLMNRRPFDQ